MAQDILTAPNPKLNEVSQRVQKVDKAAKKLAQDLKDTLAKQKDPEGVGLSAPQIGVLKRVFILNPGLKSNFLVVINPEVVKVSKKTNLTVLKGKEPDLEGCLSVPGVYALVERPWEITVTFHNENFEVMTQKLTGFLAVAFQHELDHLEGTLFTQRALEQGREIIVD